MKNSFIVLLVTAVAAAGLIAWQFMPGGPIHVQVNVKMPDLSADAVQGRTLFETNCAACHGKSGGGTENGPPLIHKIYEPSHHGDMSFYMAVKQGVRAHHWKFGNMAPVEGVSDNDMSMILAFVREVQRHNGIE